MEGQEKEITPELMPRGIVLCLFKPPLFCK